MSRFRRWRQQRARRAGVRIDEVEERGQLRQWFLLTDRRDCYPLSGLGAERLHPLYPPREMFWADPFSWAQGDRHFIFFEEFPFATGRGHISAMQLDCKACPIGTAVTVLEEPHHLSYPFLFEFERELYMVPEKAGSRRLDLYRSVAFPEQWEFVKTLIEGAVLSDPTLFEHEGRWWLFCAARSGRLRVNETLIAFHALSPLSEEWAPHPANPLVRDFSRGRPAGRIFRDAWGRLFRPSQDCVRRYGYGLNLNEILCLSTRDYEERLIWHVNGPHAGGWRGLHHLDWHKGVLAVDAQRLIPAAGASD